MAATNPDLTVDICCGDGSRTAFYQSDEGSIDKILEVMLSPRLFVQPLLMFASERGLSSFASRSIDVIRVQTPTPLRLALPPGFVDVAEVGRDTFAAEVGGWRQNNPECVDNATPEIEVGSHVEIHTTGAWVVFLRLFAMTNGTLQDQRLALTHFFDMPVVVFRLEGGGVGFVNPSNINRMTVHPGFKGAPKSALPADLLRWTPASARKWDRESR
jgi:hypothetical protein